MEREGEREMGCREITGGGGQLTKGVVCVCVKCRQGYRKDVFGENKSEYEIKVEHTVRTLPQG